MLNKTTLTQKTPFNNNLSSKIFFNRAFPVRIKGDLQSIKLFRSNNNTIINSIEITSKTKQCSFLSIDFMVSHKSRPFIIQSLSRFVFEPSKINKLQTYQPLYLCVHKDCDISVLLSDQLTSDLDIIIDYSEITSQ